MAYRIEMADEADEHLSRLSAGERSMVVVAIEEQLTHQPTIETRNRKHMRPNPVAPWVLRVSRLRILRSEGRPDPIVTVRAIGIKRGNKVTIGGVEVDLS